MKQMTTIECVGCGTTKEAATRGLAQALALGFRPFFPMGETAYLCAECAKRAEELATELVKLLGGRDVQLWQLIPEEKRESVFNKTALRRRPGSG
jgi:hypothetical protein